MVANSGEQKFAVGLWLRVVSAGAFLAFVGILSVTGLGFPYRETATAYFALAALIIVNGIYWIIGRARGFPVQDFYVHWLIDLVFISITLHGLGTWAVPVSVASYNLIVVTSAIFISKHASYRVATGATVAYGVLLLAEQDEWLRLGGTTGAVSAGATIFLMGSAAIFFFLFAYLVGTLADELSKTNRTLIDRNDTLANQNLELGRLHAELEFQTNVLTHDIRSPIAAAGAAVSFLGKELSGAGANRLIEIIAFNVDRAEHMIDALRRLQEVGHVGEEEDLNIEQIAREVLLESKSDLDRKGIEVKLAVKVSRVIGIARNIETVLRNLIQNAVRHTPGEGQGWIAVRSGREDDGWYISVEDNGRGVPKEYQETIFDMFRKVPGEEVSQGMGVGLALVRRIAESQGGKAWVESDGVRGAKFCVKWPPHRLSQLSEPGSHI